MRRQAYLSRVVGTATVVVMASCFLLGVYDHLGRAYDSFARSQPAHTRSTFQLSRILTRTATPCRGVFPAYIDQRRHQVLSKVQASLADSLYSQLLDFWSLGIGSHVFSFMDRDPLTSLNVSVQGTLT